MSNTYLPGKFVWFEHLSGDIPKAQAFYAALFGWGGGNMPMGAEPYPVIKNGEQGIGGYRKGPSHVASHWVAYLSVPDVDAAFKSATAAGCRALLQPTDFGPVGRAAALKDPTGATFALWKGAQGDPADAERPPIGGWFWNECVSQDEKKALAFYETQFGYTHEAMDMGPMGTYYVLKKDGVPRAGVMKAMDPKSPSMWLPYVAVKDCDATAKKAATIGGQVVVVPRDIPGVGRFAVAVDTTGAAIAFITPKMG
jgi:predicted enzyme related to lactoylglutathione lyase